MKFFANDILFKRNIDAIFIDGRECNRIHFKNYYTKDFGVLYLKKNSVNLLKKECNYRTREIYSFEVKNVISEEGEFLDSFLDKEIKKLKMKINKYF